MLPDRIVALLASAAFNVVLANEELDAGLIKVLNQVYQRWPEVWEEETRERLSVAGNGVEGQENPLVAQLWIVMNAVLGGGASATGVFLSSASPDFAVRLIALKELLSTKDVFESNPEFVHDTLLARLAEAEESIATALLSTDSAVKILHSALSAEEIFETLQRLLNTPKLPLSVATIVLHYLAGPFLAQHPEKTNQVLSQIFWGRILVGKSAGEERVTGFKALAGSSLAKHAWIQGISDQLLVDWDPKTIKMPATAIPSNAAIVEKIAKNVAGLAEEPKAAFIEFLRTNIAPEAQDSKDETSFTKASAKVLSLLVAAQLAAKLAVVERIHFVAGILETLQIESQGIDAFVGKATELFHDEKMVLDAPLAQSVFSHAQSGKTLRRIRAATISIVIASVRPMKEVSWSWLAGKVTVEVQAYRNLATIIYHFVNTASKSIGSEGLAKKITRSIFTGVVGEDSLAFLASIWTLNGSAELSAIALRDAAAYVVARAAKGSIDFQMLLPAVLVALQSNSAKVRTYGMNLLTALESVIPSATAQVYGQEVFYGPTSGSSSLAFDSTQANLFILGAVQYLDVADIANYVKQLLERKTELTVDGAYLRTFHEKVLVSSSEGKRKAR